MPNLGIKELKVYVPAANFDESKRFYAALGFEQSEAWAGDIDCRLGNAVFRLQNYYQKQWAENMMMLFDVHDANAWYEHAKPIIESGQYSNVRIAPPEQVGGATLVHIWDPCGVLLIFIQ